MKHTKWKTLYRAGALAPLIAMALYVSQFLILVVGDPYPVTMEEWFALFQRSKVLGLWYLNSLDIISISLLGILFLALYVALRHLRPSLMAIALYVAMLGIVVFVVPRALTLSIAPLSDLHAAASTEAQRAMYVAAGEALGQVATATPQTLGYFIMAIAGLIVSVVILQTKTLIRAAGYVGILWFVAAAANYAAWLLAPFLAPILMPINGLLWLIWMVLISFGLFRLAGASSDDKAAKDE